MATFRIIRQPADGRFVRGKMYRVDEHGNIGFMPMCSTLENAEYLIPEGTYPVVVNRSPKFKRPLPLLEQVPNRTGIRIHRGIHPKHSKGCILVTPAWEHYLTEEWLALQAHHENIKIQIINEKN